jgi:putative ABC transport system permease protein
MLTLRVALLLAYKSIIRGHKSTALLLIFILSLSFLNLMFVTGILQGFSDAIKDTIIDSSTSHISVQPQEEPIQKDYIIHQDEVRSNIESIPGVIATARHYTLNGLLAYDKEKNGKFKRSSAQIIGIDTVEEKEVLKNHESIVQGGYLDGLRSDEILLGSGLAGGYGLPTDTDLGGVIIGSKVRVTYTNGVTRTYTIKGVYHVPIGSVSLGAFISAKEAESVLATYNTATEILVKTDLNHNTLDNYYEKIKEIVPNLIVKKYTERMAAIGTLLDAFNLISFVVSVISIIVAAITIFVLIYVNAINKRRQIGILKAMGIKENIIVYSYVFQSMFYAIFGVITGLVLVFFVLVPYLVSNPIQLPFGKISLEYTSLKIISGVVSLIAAGILAGWAPAKIVARENILKAIWG